MKNRLSLLCKITAVIALLPMQSLETQAEVGLAPPGFMLTKYIDDTFILDSSADLIQPYIAAPLIEKYINKVAPNRERRYSTDLSTQELSQRIAGAAYCFQIDPFVLTALIRKESILYDQYAVSPTGAVGYTQFTSIAAREVSEQLGIKGTKAALGSTISYLNGVLTGDCLRDNGGYTTMGKKYVPLWKQSPAVNYAQGSVTQSRQMVKMMDDHPEFAIIYGAILLKVDLSMVKSGYKTGCIKQPSTMKQIDTFREVLMFYNGDHCGVQVQYQRDILDNFYVGITGRKPN